MKLIQLQEARYAGDHPVINKLKDILKRGLSRPKFWGLEMRVVSGVVKSLTDMFGPPRVGAAGDPDENVYHWEPKFNDHRYGITIGHDRQSDPPYGLEIYYIEGPKRTDDNVRQIRSQR